MTDSSLAPTAEFAAQANGRPELFDQAAADYEAFWETLNSDDLYADLYADVSGFEELMCTVPREKGCSSTPRMVK